MLFVTRAILSILSGIGAGLLGFWFMWRCFIGSAWDQVPGPGYDGLLLAGVFIPGVLVSLAVFRTISKATEPSLSVTANK